MTVYYLQNETKKAAQSEKTGFYTAAYIEEMVSRLGVPAKALSVSQVSATAFAAEDAVLIGAETLSADVASVLKEAAAKGTLIVGFATKGAEAVFGCHVTDRIVQTDPYETIGYFTKGEGSHALPVISDVLVTDGNSGSIQIGDNAYAGLTAGENTCYFPFDLPETLIKIIQGKPVSGPSNYFPVGRTPDGRVLSYDYDSTVPAADEYLLILEELLYGRGVPMVHTLPALADGTPADLLFYFGGDDDNTSAQLDEEASRIMYERGLPYHMNLMPGSDKGDYTLTKEQFEAIRARGHELALHYNMTGCPFTQDSFDNQMGTYMEAYGELPVSNVAHCLVQEGIAEYARYQAKWGVKGDNGRMGYVNLDDINAFNIYDFGFGTAFPHFIYDDASHGGVRLDFCGIPVSYYEPRLGGAYGDSDEKLKKCADNAAYYGHAVNLFSHPHYVAFYRGYDSNMTLGAFDRILAICKEKGWRPYLAGVDEWCLWWHQRAACRLTRVGDTLTVNVAGESPVVIKIPLTRPLSSVTVDGIPAMVTKKEIGGLTYGLVTVSGAGEHTLIVHS